jgi:hypothetical protein
MLDLESSLVVEKTVFMSGHEMRERFTRREIYVYVHALPSNSPITSKRFVVQSHEAKKTRRAKRSLTVSHLVNKRFHVAQVVFERAASGDS